MDLRLEAAALDPKLTVAHSALAGMLYTDKDYAGAAAAFAPLSEYGADKVQTFLALPLLAAIPPEDSHV